jgi:RNA polymerase sigma-70 factor (ECF subfamily)
LKKTIEDVARWIEEIAAADSQTAFKSLYLAYFQRLMRFTNCYVATSSEAEEVVSDTFLAIWDNRKSLPAVSCFDAYLYSIARNKAVSYYRSQHIEKIELKESEIDLFFQTETTPEDDLIAKEDIERLNAAINSLPDKCKMVFKLVREDKLKYKDVATILDISVKTVEAHLATAIKKLREALISPAGN